MQPKESKKYAEVQAQLREALERERIAKNNLHTCEQHLTNARKDAQESREFAEEHHAAMVLLDALEAAPREGYTFLNGRIYPLTLRQRLLIALNAR